ncbi:hypothetical protein BAU15_06000 [Enterococcus sp. JM4C]|uniref:hypothetical protein n=1 Tax=Candidatus Enterococcus huntleyi TaxID=1857217 RepID=UPI00137B44F1|nr:hypothetical protein [Enterococcus sp. JM4C]KAF1297102.1 hypothetical protein BAU15_06000 [Enterococcus sp. JM4C]
MKKVIYYFLGACICAIPIVLQVYQDRVPAEKQIDISPFCIAVLIMTKLSSVNPKDKNKLILPIGVGVGYTLNFSNKWIFYPLLILAIVLIAKYFI